MDADRWERLHSLYLAACDLDVEAREAFVSQATVESGIRDEVLAMLALETGGVRLRVESRLLGDGDRAGSAGWTDPVFVGSRLGRYVVLERIGRGGMGDVFLAEWRDGDLRREVAIKLLRMSVVTPEAETRFRAEQAILARLTHPGIVGLVDTGVTPEGQPYFVMPVVRGMTITEWCDAHAATVPQRLDLFKKACEAVHHAHRTLVVHRDLKPSNILVTEDGNVHLLDFGIAKLVDTEEPGTHATSPDARFLTLAYAAPEQIAGEPASTSNDVYALGVVLYELLCGHLPHAIQGRDRAALERAILDRPPVGLTSGVTAPIARQRTASVRDLRRILRGDLETVVLTALHKDPERRYGSAAELADDVQRWQRSLPVRARADTWRYRARTFVRRNRVASTAAVLVCLALVLSATTFAVQSRRVAAERDRLAGVVSVLAEVFGSVNPIATPGVDTLSVGRFIEGNQGRILSAVADDPALESELAATFGSLHHAREEWDAADSLLHRAYVRGRAAWGEEDPRTVDALHAYAVLRSKLGAADAESLLRHTVSLQRRVATSPSVKLSNALYDLANVTDSWADRRVLLGEAVSLSEAVCDGDPLCLARGYNALAIGCFTRDSLVAAADHFEHALDLLREGLPPSNPNVMTVTRNLATCLSGIGRAAEAETLLTSVMALEGERLGDRTSRVGVNLNNLALAQLAQGRIDEARRALLRARSINHEVYGPVHPLVANTEYNLFRVEVLRGHLADAKAHLSSAIEACGPGAAARLRDYQRFGALLDLYEKRTVAARDTLLVWRDEHGEGEDTRMTMHFRFLLGWALVASGDSEAAREEFERMRDYYAVRGANQREMSAAAEGGIGMCLAAGGAMEEAQPLLERARNVYGAFGMAEPGFVTLLRSADAGRVGLR